MGDLCRWHNTRLSSCGWSCICRRSVLHQQAGAAAGLGIHSAAPQSQVRITSARQPSMHAFVSSELFLAGQQAQQDAPGQSGLESLLQSISSNSGKTSRDSRSVVCNSICRVLQQICSQLHVPTAYGSLGRAWLQQTVSQQFGSLYLAHHSAYCVVVVCDPSLGYCLLSMCTL